MNATGTMLIDLVLLFFIYSLTGWCIEVCLKIYPVSPFYQPWIPYRADLPYLWNRGSTDHRCGTPLDSL